jgi:signal transduction histidine kinase
MIALTLFIRNEMTERISDQYQRRVDALVHVIEDDLGQQSEIVAASLAVLRQAVVDDTRFRHAAVDGVPDERRYLLDYAGNAMRLSGLSMMQIQNDAGRIISSGHFRNEFDRLEPELPRLLADTPAGTALLHVRAADSPFHVLARVDSFEMGNRRFTIVAGTTVGDRFLRRLAREDELTVELVYGDQILASSGEPHSATVTSEVEVPFIDSRRDGVETAVVRVTHGRGTLTALRQSLDRWFLVAIVAAVVLSVLLVSWLASRISRPIVELADKTSRIDLDRLDVDFDSARKDEIGTLSRLLGAMTVRLRTSAASIKDAERRATLGELARQVNHDIKNGLTPIRNIFRHLAELARSESKELPSVFSDRQNTLDSSISYLEDLASNYARLSRRSEKHFCDVAAIVRQVVDNHFRPDGVTIETRLADGATVLGDPVSLRRVLENLIANAVDSIEARGRVTVVTEFFTDDTGHERVRIMVVDTGCGMTDEQRGRVFDDFYTTRENGTGLGLSIVRRLVMDLDGSITVESEEGKGSRFVVDLPRAGTS